jgi:predicted phage-related endonuclease
MKSHLQLVPTKDMTREAWLAYRHTGLGASEVGACLGLDDYLSSLELYYYKIGDAPRLDTESMAAFMGRYLEDNIAEMWQYWDPTAPNPELVMIDNFRAGTIVRKCRRINAFVRNPKYPWLYVSLDRIINKHGAIDEGTLELKTLGGWESDKWVGGLPPKFITQVNTQMAVCEFVYGEMAVLQDGRRFDVMPFELNANIVEAVVTRTKEFWDRVLAGRKLVNEKYLPEHRYNQRRLDDLQYEIDRLAPEPDGSLAYDDYLKERFKNPTTSSRRGTEVERRLAMNHVFKKKLVDEAAEELRQIEGELKVAMADAQALDFGADGKVYWTKTVQGNRIFRNKIRTAV